MRGMLESDDVTSVDIREMRLLSTQLSIGNALLKDEQYSVPVMTGDGVVSVSLKIVRGVEKKGVVDITMESALRGKLAAVFHAKEHGMTGLIATDNADTKELMEQLTGKLIESFDAEEQVDVRCAYSEELDLNRLSGLEDAKTERTDEGSGDLPGADRPPVSDCRNIYSADS